ncbi:hypothetical protein F5Y03DRAFT_397570 [Xylaria venustula]|nr:hypothetical protein F5Y03DRAFT_397570 [Xylaria venustula]
MLVYKSLLTLFASRLVVGGVLGTRDNNQFRLYAYGGGISGAQVFYSNGAAFVGNQTQMDDNEAASVMFTTGPNDAFIGNPDMQSSRGVPSWTNKALYIPTSKSASHDVGFTSSESAGSGTDSDIDTTGFIFYDAHALHVNADNSLSGLWYLLPTQSHRVWSLHWNATGGKDDGHLSVTLRSVAPAQPFDLA